MAVKKTYRINLRNYGSPPAVMVSQYDEDYAIAFEIFDGPLPVLASSLSGYTFKLKGRQPGNPPFLAYEFEGTLATALNAVVSFEIDTTMTGRAGKGTAELVILDEENDVKFASVNFTVYTEPAAVPDGSIDADVERAQEIADEVAEIVDGATEGAEAWAVGQRGGVDVENTDPTYHNNAKYYAESISGVTDQVATNTSDISDLKEDLNLIPKESESDAENVDLDISDRFGNVLVRMADGHVQTKYFDSEEVSGTAATSAELDLSTYPTVNYNFESGNTWTSGGYRGVMIPVADLGDYVRFVATGNKIVLCFLTDNVITAGELPHTCSGCTPTAMSKGADVTLPVPPDCAYLYVYVSQNSAFIGTIHVYALVSTTKVKGMIADLQAQINVLKSQTGICYITDTEQILRTLKHWHTNANGFRATATGDNLVTIAHISDVHNDPTAYGRFIDLLNDNVGVIDVGLVTGDLVDGPGTDCFTEMVAEEENLVEGTKMLKVVGNHDRISAPLADLFDYMNMEISTDGTDLYYVHDFTAQKIRLIVLNQYEATSGTTGRTGYYSQTQLDWFVSKLAEAITNNYQVAVAFHAHMEAGLPTRNDKGFCQHDYNGQIESASGDHPIQDIIDAFQRGATINKSYTYTEQEVTVTVNTTFSAKGVFIAYFCGHEHSDMIGYSKVYPNQLVCMVQGAVVDSTKRNEATAHWQGMYDTPRVSGTSTVDSINVYAIDRIARLVKVAKIGSTLTDKFVPRSFAVFGY